MRFYWLLPSVLSIFLCALPASAAKLLSWRINAAQNRLVFRTDSGVQPKAILLANPTRLIIDLPGISFKHSTVTQPLKGAIHSLRVGQFDETTTRLVIELNPGYTLDPKQVLVRGSTPVEWLVQIPTPQRVENSAGSGSSNPVPSNSTSQVLPSNNQSGFQLQSLQVTQDGFFIRTSGSNPRLKVTRSDDRRAVNIDLEDATLSPSLSGKDQQINRYGVSHIQFSQLLSSSRGVRVTLNVRENSPTWQASFSNLGGIVVLPDGISASKIDNVQLALPSSNPSSNNLTTIQAVELVSNNTQLVIRTDRGVKATSNWDNSEGVYRITIPEAQLAPQVKGPQLDANSPIVKVRLKQQESGTVEITVKPAAGVFFGQLSQISEQLVGLQLLRNGQAQIPPGNPIPTPSPENSNPPVLSPIIPSGRVLVLVDPGHGGKDSGAPGVGGILEKDIVLSISKQVAALLEQKGVQAVLTRDSDYFVDLAPRVEMVPQVHANLFVSIHANSIDNRPDVNGLETYYYGDRSRGLARTIYNSIVQSIAISNRGVRTARFYVLRKNSIPATLVEVGYVTSPTEGPKLTTPDYQRQMAAAIARGILLYIQQNQQN